MHTLAPLALGAAALTGLYLLVRPRLHPLWRVAAIALLLIAAAGLVYWRRRVGEPPVEAQQLLNGLFLGSIYALIALGYTMVYGVLKLINFAHGEVFMTGTYLAFFVFTALGDLPLLAVPVALVLAMVVCAALGVTIERGAYRPLRRAPRLAALITAIGVSLLLQNIALLLIGASPKTVPTTVPTGPIEGILSRTGLVVNLPNLITVGAAVALMLGLRFFVTQTRTGRAMRAVAEDREAAQLMGVDVDRIIAITFVIGSALAGAGGVLWGMRYPSVTPTLGVLPGLKAFVAAVLGGIGSIPGAMLGGLLIGLIEALISAISAAPETVIQCLLTALMVVAFWRLAQAHLRALPHTPTGGALRIGGSLAVAVLCYLVAGVAAVPLTRLMTATPTLPILSGSTFQDAVVFLILIVILIVKPTGLMGRYAPEKV